MSVCGCVGMGSAYRLFVRHVQRARRQFGLMNPRPLNWEQELVRRSICVTCEVTRQDSIAVPKSYAGEIYNASLQVQNKS